jgi:ATP-dependent exoDNAse (exonuclease V) beta subunit
MQNEKRLLDMFSGNNMDASINFIPKMDYKALIRGYSSLLHTIYSQKEYFRRVNEFLKEYQIPRWQKNRISFSELKAFFRLLWLLGFVEKGKKYFWKLLFLSLFKYPKKFTTAMTLAVYGFHFRRVIRAV